MNSKQKKGSLPQEFIVVLVILLIVLFVVGFFIGGDFKGMLKTVFQYGKDTLGGLNPLHTQYTDENFNSLSPDAQERVIKKAVEEVKDLKCTDATNFRKKEQVLSDTLERIQGSNYKGIYSSPDQLQGILMACYLEHGDCNLAENKLREQKASDKTTNTVQIASCYLKQQNLKKAEALLTPYKGTAAADALLIDIKTKKTLSPECKTFTNPTPQDLYTCFIEASYKDENEAEALKTILDASQGLEPSYRLGTEYLTIQGRLTDTAQPNCELIENFAVNNQEVLVPQNGATLTFPAIATPLTVYQRYQGQEMISTIVKDLDDCYLTVHKTKELVRQKKGELLNKAITRDAEVNQEYFIQSFLGTPPSCEVKDEKSCLKINDGYIVTKKTKAYRCYWSGGHTDNNICKQCTEKTTGDDYNENWPGDSLTEQENPCAITGN